jgi:penicillin-binding protein 1A
MRTALRTSSNRAAVRMLEEIGIDTAVAYAKKLGVGSMPSVPSLALGSGEVTLLDMTSAYGAFAAGGVLHHPRLVRRVEDSDGTVLFSAEDASEQAVTPQTAFLMSTMLADVVNAGTAWKARQLGFTLPAGGKTGTTNDYHDAWFVGFTPSLTGGVWVGYDTPQPILPGSAYAGDVAVPLWAEFMKRATAGQKPEWIPVPKNIVAVEVCRLSGKRPAGGCNTVEVALESGGTDTRSMVFTEYFVKGTEPSDTCPLHVGRSLFARLTDWMHAPAAATSVKSSASAPVRETAAVVPPEPVQAPAVEKDDQPRKRGFWSRLFGRKKDADEKPKKK